MWDTQKRDVGYSETGCGILIKGMWDTHKRDVGYSQTGFAILGNEMWAEILRNLNLRLTILVPR